MSKWTKTATSKGGDFVQPPAGNHPAVCVAIIDMGTQESEYQGEKREDERAYFIWELVNEKAPSGKNFVIGIDLTNSLHEKAKLRKWIESRQGKKLAEDTDYSISEELGKPCLLNVIMKNGYPKIDGLGPVPKGMNVPAPAYTPLLWSLDDVKDGKFSLPSWVPYLYGESLIEHIKRCKELQGVEVVGTTNSSGPVNNAFTKAAGQAGPPPRRGVASSAGKATEYWVAFGESEAELMTEARFREEYDTRKVSAENIEICTMGSDEYVKANKVFPDLVPF